MLSLRTDGREIKELGQRASDEDVGLRQFDGTIIDWLPGGDEWVLMTRNHLAEGFKHTSTNVNRTKQGLGVVRLNVRTLKAETVEAPRRGVLTYMSDGRGQVRLLGMAEFNGEVQLSGRAKYLYRTPGSREWKDLTPFADMEDFEPLAIDAGINALYALRKRNGRMVLTRITLNEAVTETVVASHPTVDIYDVVRSGDGQRVIGYTFVEDARQTVYFDPEYKSLETKLRGALKDLPLINFVGTSEDQTKTLLFAGSDANAGRYYLFDRSTKALGQLLPVRPQLEGRTLAKVTSVRFPAADGTQIPAYLTLPAGKPGTGLPAVVLPHGGPSARDEWGFDWLAQFLAARGYAVLQPNYRGSAGFGDAWLNENGFKNWRTSIADISAGSRYLAAQGIADPKRIAILGWSYGGYAALQSAAVDPALYKAVVAIAPVTDLEMLKADYDGFSNSRMVDKFIGSGAHVAAGSPLRQAPSIAVPVLLVHGDQDVNVGYQHAVRMDAALRKAGKPSELLLFKGLDHQIEDSEARALMLKKAGELLDRTIGRP
jgi:dipeptidyl aminopeptidase/acylaminoacyl peptidase